MYEKGSCMMLTRKYCPSGDASIERNMAGAPTFLTARLRTSITASCPVV
jgi:hypothetical protein